ncbi:phage holin family protein [Sphingomonas sp. A2-49]|uniref:phage holin family protein n=1 Tax=Sphingomonas sp. A2-49 TaxID=1391375 RepID=UPI0021D18565|nr:phage holin family protein [Sphingomonas sp. A2-49]MCU6453450.1 phage holin family protein [Sphingomonas sp. A2-49]
MAVIEPVTGDEGIGTLVSQLVEDVRGLAGAEVALVKARVGERASAYRNAAIFFAVAGVLALAALVALLVGIIMALATLIGPGLATAAVVLATLAIAAVLAIVGKGRLAPGVTR